MANRDVSATIKLRRATSAQWATANPVLAAGEVGLDITKNQLKVGDGIATWNVLPYLNSDLLDGYHASDFSPIIHTHPFSNPNLLHNWDFRNPINQRGVSGTISAGGYFIDRWFKYAAGEIVITSAGLNCGSIIEQRIEGIGLAGQTATFSIMIGGVIYAKTMTFPSDTGTIASSTNMPMAVIFAHDTTSMRVRLNVPSGASTYQAVKLELGTVSTLHLDPPMDHAIELPKCQRFFFTGVYLTVIGFTISTTAAIVTFAAPVNMRILPSVNQSVLGLRVGSTRYNNCPFAISEMKGNTFVQATVTIPSGTWQNTSPATGEIPGTMFVSADL